MNLEGTYHIKAPREKVFGFITEPNKISRCLPDLKSLQMEGEDRFVALVRVGVGFIKGDFKFRMAVVEKQPPARVRLQGNGSGAGSSVDLDSVIELREVQDATELAYKAEVKLSGVIVGLAQRVIGSATEKTVNSLFECLKKELET
jgi:carbon monoxide dehydrogenase subunit G